VLADGDLGVKTFNVNYDCPAGERWMAKQADIAGAAFVYCALRWPGRRAGTPLWQDSFRAEFARWARLRSGGVDVPVPSMRTFREAFFEHLADLADMGATRSRDGTMEDRRDAHSFMAFWNKLRNVATAGDVRDDVYDWKEQGSGVKRRLRASRARRERGSGTDLEVSQGEARE
jgi:hypothetical protein